jgi:hypothetical protein
VTAVNPVWLWVILTVASVVVGGAMLWIAFATVNRRQRQQLGFEVKTTATGAEPAALREKEHHG